jgi:hypothetical protein
MFHKLTTAILAVFLAGSALFAAESAKPRQELSLDGPGWKVWLDQEAKWADDTLYAPREFKLAELPVNPPTGGWDVPAAQGTACATPACVEQLFAKGGCLVELPWGELVCQNRHDSCRLARKECPARHCPGAVAARGLCQPETGRLRSVHGIALPF